MRYDELLAQYHQAHRDWTFGRIDTAEASARAEAGIAAVTAIADESPDRSERHAMLSLNETLVTLIAALRLGPPAGGQ